MSLLVTGSIGIDTVKTPYGVSENCLGGAAVYFSMAASFFSPVRFVGVIGADCPFDLAKVFAGRDVDLAGLEVRAKSKTFRWAGTYHEDMDDRTTDCVELNVLAEAPPAVPEKFRDSKFVFLANTAPKLQLELLGQVNEPVFVAADTMNLWIESYLGDLQKLLKKIDCLVINEDEVRLLAREHNLIKAARKILDMGPKAVIVKKGESGSLLYSSGGEKFLLPAYPADEVKDPTGAGDSFAGGFMGYLAQKGQADFENLKAAVAYGTVTASFTINDFSLKGLQAIKRTDIDKRLEVLRQITRF
ncbi:MAG: bifunctional hydroxymethylpyrimidine kinase/phosphomethylpyrimidine kinase [Sedimentisphaerales bacterium]|nr:bifunctional hydroxymethylpyrimidine kinase/phosphomethylpyrimidine kinase [Sedimentisphaerales bacterium]